MLTKKVILKKEDRIATITLNRPERMNALDLQTFDELRLAIEDVAKDDDIRVLVLTGAGRAFCAGGDFRYGQVRTGEVAPEEAEQRGEFGGETGKLLNPVTEGVFLALHRLGKPIIAMVNGAAAGGGFDLVLACDIRIGSENARFGMMFTRVGIVPVSGGAWLLPRVVGLAKACELIFTGDLLEADEAYRIGVLNKLVPAADLEKETMAVARKIAEAAPIAIRLSKLMLCKGLETNFEAALAFGLACGSITLATEDHKEGVRAFAEKRPPVFLGR